MKLLPLVLVTGLLSCGQKNTIIPTPEEITKIKNHVMSLKDSDFDLISDFDEEKFSLNSELVDLPPFTFQIEKQYSYAITDDEKIIKSENIFEINDYFANEIFCSNKEQGNTLQLGQSYELVPDTFKYPKGIDYALIKKDYLTSLMVELHLKLNLGESKIFKKISEINIETRLISTDSQTDIEISSNRVMNEYETEISVEQGKDEVAKLNVDIPKEYIQDLISEKLHLVVKVGNLKTHLINGQIIEYIDLFESVSKNTNRLIIDNNQSLVPYYYSADKKYSDILSGISKNAEIIRNKIKMNDEYYHSYNNIKVFSKDQSRKCERKTYDIKIVNFDDREAKKVFAQKFENESQYKISLFSQLYKTEYKTNIKKAKLVGKNQFENYCEPSWEFKPQDLKYIFSMNELMKNFDIKVNGQHTMDIDLNFERNGEIEIIFRNPNLNKFYPTSERSALCETFDRPTNARNTTGKYPLFYNFEDIGKVWRNAEALIDLSDITNFNLIIKSKSPTLTEDL
ncbi:MAG: hypothetical protein H6622_06990 [Halobacteriovoraceae bacterium]|nr:hypothetical protein [Halobacteriovoraceae bacterium]